MHLLKTKRQKVIAVIAVVFAVLVIASFLYIEILVSGLSSIATNPSIPSPEITGYLNYQGLLSYNYSDYEYPYVSVIYATSNALQVYANASIYKYPLPSHLYILNSSNECIGCGNVTQAENVIFSGIKGYGMLGLYHNTSYVSIDNVGQIDNDSILVILNGFVPSELEANNFSLLETLMGKHTSIIYVGLNFSSMVVSGPKPVQEPTSGVPPFLYAKSSYYYPGTPGPYAFNSPTFGFRNGTSYYYMSYANYSNGTIVAFTNNLESWPSEQDAGADIARAIWQMFWLPRYSYGSTAGTVPQGGSGSIGVIMNGTALPYNLTLPNELNGGYYRVVLQAAPLYAGKNPAYLYIAGQPKIGTRGYLAIQPKVIPNASNVKIVLNVTSKPSKPVNLSTFISVYNQNLSSVFTIPGPSIHGFSSKSPALIIHQNIPLGPGRYIMVLKNFSDNTELAEGTFDIPPYNITLIGANLTIGRFIFEISSGGALISNIAYNASVNNLYASSVSGVVKSGILEYSLPAGVPVPNQFNFTITMLGQTYQKYYTHTLLPFTINSQYIELGLVIVMIIIMIVFVRAPQRDEFYIDVPNLPESKKLEIKIKASEVLSVFDKLNANYHWRYMPLSKTEMKSAIALNLKYNNIPVELTYRNIDAILDSLLVNRYIVGSDDLYAPTAWIDASKHDIEYLATFKKLRIYFVTHSYTFTDLDISEEADIAAMLHGDKKYIVIYSKTTKFKNIPIYPQSRTCLVFINNEAMEDFKSRLYSTSSEGSEKLKMYISADYIRLVDADEIGRYIG